MNIARAGTRSVSVYKLEQGGANTKQSLKDDIFVQACLCSLSLFKLCCSNQQPASCIVTSCFLSRAVLSCLLILYTLLVLFVIGLSFSCRAFQSMASVSKRRYDSQDYWEDRFVSCCLVFSCFLSCHNLLSWVLFAFALFVFAFVFGLSLRCLVCLSVCVSMLNFNNFWSSLKSSLFWLSFLSISSVYALFMFCLCILFHG